MLATLLLTAVLAVAAENTEDSTSCEVSISYADATNTYSTSVLEDDDFMEEMIAINRERLPERVVHAKGTGAFGHFTVTKNISHICKADFLKFGKTTPVVIRFSTGGGDRGSTDFPVDSRGWSIRFYTDEGNFDILGFHTEMYFYTDPLRFSTIVHGVKKNVTTNLADLNTFWDAALLVPESMNFFTRILSDEGIPAAYPHMPGHSIHTYPVENDKGVISFVRFHFMPDAGVKTVTVEEAAKLTATDPDRSIKGLYNSIKNGEYPSWTVYMQIMSKDDAKKLGSRAFDVTRHIPKDKFPYHEIGTVTLNRNAENYKNEIERLTLCPCNLVPGIHGPPDKIFESRILIYSDTQKYRVGKNHNNYPVNCPLNSILTYNREGVYPVGNNGGNIANYYPNSFGGPQPYDMPQNGNKECKASGLFNIKEKLGPDNFDQVKDFYNSLSEERKTTLINNMKTYLLPTMDFIQKRAITMFKNIDSEFGSRLEMSLNTQ